METVQRRQLESEQKPEQQREPKEKEPEPRELPNQEKTMSKVPARKSLSPAKRRAFTSKETEVVMLFFSSHIQVGDTPSAIECRDFLRHHAIDRSPKQVKNIIKAQK